MYRISKTQKKGNIFLEELDSYLFAEIVKVENNKIIFTKQLQKLFITENFSNFSDITTSIEDLKKLQDTTIILTSAAGKEKEITIEIEGGI